MEQKLEQILTDIYALEPDLRERDVQVRALVRELLAARPHVVFDPAFAAALRTRVLAQVASPAAVPQAPLHRDTLWWALRLAPIGAFAALTLALIGGTGGLPQPLTPEMISDSTQTPIQTSPAPMQGRAPTPVVAPDMMMKSTPAGFGGGISGDTGSNTSSGRSMASDAALMAEDVDVAMGDSLFIADQVSGSSIMIENVTLNVTGHVRVFAYEDGAPRAVLGTTGVLSAGTHYSVPVALSRATNPGETLYAQLFASNGDEVFTPYEDAPIHDALGELIYVIFMIHSR